MKTKQFLVTLIAVLSLSVGQAWGWTITLHYGLGGQTTTSHTGGVALPTISGDGLSADWASAQVWMKAPVEETDEWPDYSDYYNEGASNFTSGDVDLYALYYYYNSSTYEYYWSTYPYGVSRTISFSVGYGDAPSNRSGSTITLPTIPTPCSAASSAGWEAYGWATSEVAVNSTSASIVGRPGDTYYPDANRTLYAVYILPGKTLSSSATFAKYSSGSSTSSMPTSGYVVMLEVNQPKSAVYYTMNGNYISEVGTGTDKPTLNKSSGIDNPAATIVWEISSPASGVYTFRNLSNGKYLGLVNSAGTTASGALLDNASSDYAKWTVPYASTDGFYLQNKGQNKFYLRWTDGSGWRGNDTKNGTSDNIIFRRYTSALSVTDSKYQSTLPLCGYTVTYKSNGATSGSVPTDATVYTSGQTVTVKTNSGSLAKTGYTFGGWNTLAGGGGTTYEAGTGTFTITDNVDLYAKWVAKTYTVNLDKQDGSGGKSSVTATYGSSMPSAGDAPTFSGYTFGGYYTAQAGGGTQYYTATPSSAKSWDIDVDPSTLYAKWTQTIILDKNGGSADGALTVIYNGSARSGFTAVTKDGYVCTGYWTATSDGTKVLNNDGTFAADDVTGYVDDGTWVHSGATTLYALWEAKANTISFNNNGGSGEMASVNKATDATYALPSCTFTPPTGKIFKEWALGSTSGTKYDAGDSYTVTGSDVTFYAIWRDAVYEDLAFSCASLTLSKPQINSKDIDTVFITSTANKSVMAQHAFHVQGNGLTPSTTLTFDISDATIKGKFAIKTSTGTDVATDGSGSINTDFYIVYTPAEEDTDDGLDVFNNLSVSVGGAKKKTSNALSTKYVIGRHLPADFVIAAKKDGKWYAMPANMASTTNPKPSEIAVDNATNPSIAYVADTTIYSLEGPTSNNISSGKGQYIRFVMTPLWVDDADHTKGHAPLFGSATGTRTIGKSGNSQATSDLESGGWWWKLEQKRAMGLSNPQEAKYTIYNHNNTSSLSLRENAGDPDWGLFASGVEELRLIPASAVEYTASEVVAWAQKKLILEIAKPDLATQARAKIGDGSWSASKSLATTTGTSVKGSATKYNYTLDFTSDDFDFAANEGKMVIIELLNSGGSPLKASSVIIPRIVAADRTINKKNDDTKGPWNTEVHVLPGVTLTLDASGYVPQDMTFKELNIYPGATVVAEKGTLKATTLILRNGWDRLSATKTYDVARLYITPTNGSLNATTAYADWYIDFDQYYPIAVPWEVDLGENNGSTICYKNTKTKAIIGLSTTVRLRYYDGESRAKGLGDASKRENWKHYGESGCEDIPDKLEPSKAYAMTAKRPTGKAFSIIRLPLTIPTTTWTTGGEKGSVTAGEPAVTTHKDQVTVTAYNNDEGNAAEWARGWNFIANPYMSLYQGPITHSAGSGYNVEYANIPDVNFNEYEQYPIGTDLTKLKPASGFLIQTEADGTLTFNTDNRKASAPSYRTEEAPQASKQKAYILLSDQEANDMMGLIISDQYTAEYEMNADLEKLLGDGTSLKTYMRYGEMNMAYVAINETLAKEWIPVSVRIPETGVYTFSIHEASIADELEGVYLIDYQNGDQVTNLLADSYTFTANAGTISNRFAINAKVGERETPTAIDVVGMDKDSKEPIKFLWHDKVFIWFNGVIYDATGKKVR